MLIDDIRAVDVSATRPKHQIFNDLVKLVHSSDYTIDDVDINKPWGFYIRFEPGDADKFIPMFFAGIGVEEAKLGRNEATLSPKILLVSPGEMLSWQYHHRRAECWAFLTDGAYHKSLDDGQGILRPASSGDVVQFEALERHRLVGRLEGYSLVAEIWQHTDKDNLSDESDIVRLADKYHR